EALLKRGVPQASIHLSLERNMKCAVGYCGHCQLGPHFICRDGPVLPWPRLAGLLEVPELRSRRHRSSRAWRCGNSPPATAAS
ncbi:MAG TPA: hypothetical protein VGD25_07555, partial [Immundisolibacter sp.]